MGNVCDCCLSLFYEDEHRGGRVRGESSTYYPLSESANVEPTGDTSGMGRQAETKVSSSLPVGGMDLDSKLLASPHSLPPSLEEEKAFNIAKSVSPVVQFPKECMLCMELFTPERPEVRTLCACGVNKNAYHLECLLAWRSRSGNTMCPVCNKELFYEESLVDTGSSAVQAVGEAQQGGSDEIQAEVEEGEGEEDHVHTETAPGADATQEQGQPS